MRLTFDGTIRENCPSKRPHPDRAADRPPDEGANRGYKYVDKLHLVGPVRSLAVKPGRVLTATGKGPELGYTLTSDPTPVGVTLTLGTARSCMEFGGETKFVADKPSYVAKHARAPASCGP